MNTLVVVDVQPGLKGEYGSTCPWGHLVTDQLVANCKREILRAVADGDTIAVCTVDYFGINDEWFGPTDKRLLEHLKGYAKYVEVPKMAFGDGAINVLNGVARKTEEATSFTVIGVRANGCVKAMVEGLHRERPDAPITVVKDACNDDERYLNWSEFESIPNITLVDSNAEPKVA